VQLRDEQQEVGHVLDKVLGEQRPGGGDLGGGGRRGREGEEGGREGKLHLAWYKVRHSTLAAGTRRGGPEVAGVGVYIRWESVWIAGKG